MVPLTEIMKLNSLKKTWVQQFHEICDDLTNISQIKWVRYYLTIANEYILHNNNNYSAKYIIENKCVPAYQSGTVVVAADNVVTECRNTDTESKNQNVVLISGSTNVWSTWLNPNA